MVELHNSSRKFLKSASQAEPRDSCKPRAETAYRGKRERDLQPVAEVVAMMVAVVERPGLRTLDRDLRASE